tara:strand:- start:2500 stop:3405 length:906 start_codon:yes stop_codon:yes gene_type:complete
MDFIVVSAIFKNDDDLDILPPPPPFPEIGKEDKKTEEAERKREKEEKQKAMELKLKREEEQKREKAELKVKREREKLRKGKNKARREKVHDFFHSMGLVKTEKDKKEREKKRGEERRQKELEERKRLEEERGKELERKRQYEEEERLREKKGEEKRKQKELEEKQKEAERKNREEKEEKAKVGKEHDLEKSLKELGEIFEQNKKKKPGIIKRFIRKEKKITPEAKVKKEIKENRQGKSRTFAKCHQLLLKADDALQKNDVSTAKKFYSKTRNLYIGLEYMEKKEIYKELMSLYNNLSKGKK